MFGERSNIIALSVIMIAVAILMSIFLPNKFLTLINFQSMTSQMAEFGLLTIAMMLTMITGGIDLSVVSTASLTGIISALILKGHIGIDASSTSGVLIVILAAIIVSGFCGLINGVLIAKVGVTPILATLGTQGLYLGLAIIITKGHGINDFPEKFLFIGSGTIGKVPMPFVIFIGCVLLVTLILRRTSLGLSMYMVGSNPTASRFSGINNSIILIKTYIISGALAGLSSIIMISRVNSVRPGYGYAYLLQAILVSILGGTDPYGGSGSILGVLIALFILQFLRSGFNILSISPFFGKSMWGFMLILVMIINFFLEKNRQRIRK